MALPFFNEPKISSPNRFDEKLDIFPEKHKEIQNQNIELSPFFNENTKGLFSNLLPVLEEIEAHIQNNPMRISSELQYIISKLKDYKSLDINEFSTISHILFFCLDKKNKDLSKKLREILSSIEKAKSPEIKKKKYLKKKKTNYFLSGAFNTSLGGRIKSAIIYLSGRDDFSSHFKEKVLKELPYDIRILKSIDGKEKFIDILMENNLKFFDDVLANCKNTGFLKYYEYEEAIDFVIHSFYAYLDEKNMIEFEKESDKSDEILMNAKILEFCFKKSLKTIIKFITDRKEHILLLPSILVFSFSYRIYLHLFEHLSNWKLLRVLGEYSVITEIFELKNDPKTFIDFIHFFYNLKDNVFNPEVQKFIFNESKKYLQSSKQLNLLIYQMNPLLIYVAFSQIFYRLSKNSDNFQYAFSNIAEVILGKCKVFIDSYSDYDGLQALVTTIYFPLNKSVLDIIFEDKDFFFSCFEEKRLSTIIAHNLDNSILFDYNLMAESSLFRILKDDLDLVCAKKEKKLNEAFKIHGNMNDQEFKKKLQENNQKITKWNIFQFVPVFSKQEKVNSAYKHNENLKINHFYQRKVFFSSVSLRVLIDFIFFFVLFINVLLFMNSYTQSNYFFQSVKVDYISLYSLGNLSNTTLENWRENALTQHYLKYDNYNYSLNNDSVYLNLVASSSSGDLECLTELYNLTYSVELTNYFLEDCKSFKRSLQDFIDQNKYFEILFTILIIISGDLIIRKLYQKKVLRVNFVTVLDIFETLSMIFSFIMLMLYRNTLIEFETWEISYDYNRRIDKFQRTLNILNIFFAIYIFLNWMKITQYIKFWSKFGFIIKTIEIMVRETVVFMVVYFINIAAFSSVLYIIYSNDENFITFTKGLRNLFGYSLGGFSFPSELSNVFDWMISLILIIFLVMSNIILLNLLIAILSNAYNILESRIDLENSYNYFILQKEYFFDEKYGSLIFFPRNFNFFLLPMHLICYLFANSKINIFFVNLYFTSYFLFLLGFYILISVFLVFFAWLKVFGLILNNRYYEKCEKKFVPVYLKIIHLILWFLGGIFYLLLVILIYDVPNLFKSAYDEMILPQNGSFDIKKTHKFFCSYFENVLQNFIEEEEVEEKKEKEKHQAFIESLKKKISGDKKNLGEKDIEIKKKKRLIKLPRKIDSICVGIEFDEAYTIFNISKDI